MFFDVGDVVGAIAFAGANRLIMAQRHCLTFLDTHTGTVTPIVEMETDLPDNRLNDAKCDLQGRFWFGSMSASGKQQASLYHYDCDGSLHLMETGLAVWCAIAFYSSACFWLSASSACDQNLRKVSRLVASMRSLSSGDTCPISCSTSARCFCRSCSTVVSGNARDFS